jgi:hypothetical protein
LILQHFKRIRNKHKSSNSEECPSPLELLRSRIPKKPSFIRDEYKTDPALIVNVDPKIYWRHYNDADRVMAQFNAALREAIEQDEDARK